jgi:NitT/TauT family transport system permease protein
MSKGISAWKLISGQAVLLAVLLIISEFIVQRGMVSNLYLAPPSQVIGEFSGLFQQNLIFTHLYVTLTEFVFGYAAATILAVGIGLFLVLTPYAESFFKPFLSALMAIPKVTIIPLMTLWLGIGMVNKMVVVFVFSFFPILFNTITGIKHTAENHLKVARVLGATQSQIIKKVILPSAMPTIFAGMRVAAGTGLVGALFGEMLASKEGLGNILVKATQLYNTAQVFAIIVIVTVVSVLIIAAIDFLEKKVFLKWKSL